MRKLLIIPLFTLLLQCLPAETTQTRIRINDTQIALLYAPTNSPDPYTLSEVSGITGTMTGASMLWMSS